jgi:hypothetical protein
MTEPMPTLHEDAPEETIIQAAAETVQVPKDNRLERFMSDIGMHPDNPDASSLAVHVPGQGDRILTAVTNRNTGKPVLHDTLIPGDRFQRQFRPVQSAQPPSLKAGTHGRHGDFSNDHDRRTGRGHQLTTEDQKGLNEYHDFRGQVLQAYPRFPANDEEEEVHLEVKEGWNDNERWYNSFTHKYPGNSVNHLWPCGCEKLRGGSESSESEAE